MTITQELVKRWKEFDEKKPSCLLVEEDSDKKELSKRALLSLGVELQTARTAKEAIQLLAQSARPDHPSFDIVFLDLDIAGLEIQGIGVLEHIRKNFPSIHTVLVSSQISQGLLNVLLSFKGHGGYVGITQNPLDPADIKDIFDKHRLVSV